MFKDEVGTLIDGVGQDTEAESYAVKEAICRVLELESDLRSRSKRL